MAITHHELIVASWNSKGHSDSRIEYMSKLNEEVDIIFIQEHWHYESSICSLASLWTTYKFMEHLVCDRMYFWVVVHTMAVRFCIENI